MNIHRQLQVELHLSDALEVETNGGHLEDAFLLERRGRDTFYAKGNLNET